MGTSLWSSAGHLFLGRGGLRSLFARQLGEQLSGVALKTSFVEQV